ncbi:Mur ligase family protein [Oxobacter pfennigii]|uniref:Mur ligase family protein n=1 Tax=Oxobacter pfennigii TaxID=36849 RepID=UPI001364B90B|nr:Mur ligase family protein [Oxobacter pfennigii]
MSLNTNKRIITIGIFGSNGKTSTCNLLSRIFNSTGVSIATINDKKQASSQRIMTNIELYKRLIKLEYNDIIILEINDELLKCHEIYDIRFDILINCGISEDSYEYSAEGMDKIKRLINSLHNSKILILNTDDDIWKNNMFFNDTYLITYGLGSKSTVTASSIDYGDKLEFCYCLQRSISTLNGKEIEPMEIPVTLKAVGQHNVYNGMAAVTSALFCGISPDNIRSIMDGNLKITSGVRTIYSNNDFKVVDNLCDTLLGFETGFEAIQNISYEKMHLCFNFNSENNAPKEKLLGSIGAWIQTLKIKNISIFKYNLDSDDLDLIKLWGESFLKNDVDILLWEATEYSIEKIIGLLETNDLLAFFCSNHLDVLREKLTEILDKRILDRNSLIKNL